MANSKPGIYEILSADGSKTRIHANSKTAARRSVGGIKLTITRVADSWVDLRVQTSPKLSPEK